MSDYLKNLSDAMAHTVETLNPSLVGVDARRRFPATGIVWSADGVIVTAHHIVERDDNIYVIVNSEERHPARLIGRDVHNDLAVLKVDGVTLTPAPWGDNAALKVGHLVLALGKPGLQVRASLGVVSALIPGVEQRGEARKGKRGMRRMGGMGRALMDGFIQTDLVMYPGFSGGALVSGDGAVHGLNTSGFEMGTSVAVPVATIRNTVTMLMAHGRMRQGFLGIGVQPVRLQETTAQALEQEMGLLIVSVEANSPAHQAGLYVGDTLLTFDGEAVEQLDELLGMLQGERVGKQVMAKIVRGGEVKELAVTIAERM